MLGSDGSGALIGIPRQVDILVRFRIADVDRIKVVVGTKKLAQILSNFSARG
jgi:hypothetical protein